jgi:hypothetical protein
VKTFLAAIAASVLWMTSAQSAEIIRNDWMIVLKGFIEKGDNEKFAKITKGMPEAFVMLNSPGGDNQAAMAIGSLIFDNNYATGVRDGMMCNSACTLIWLAGKQRFLDYNAQLGFHSAAPSKQRRYERDEEGNINIAFYMRIIGVPQQVIDLQPKADPCCFNYVDYKQARAWGLLEAQKLGPSEVAAQSANSHAETERKLAEAKQQRFEIRPSMEARLSSAIYFKLNVASVDECKQKCAESIGCNVFTFSKASNICYAYSAAELAPNASFDSGVRQSATPTVVRPKAEIEQPAQTSKPLPDPTGALAENVDKGLEKNEYVRYAPSGQRIELDWLYFLRADCSVDPGIIDVTITSAPGHGTIKVIKENGFPNYEKSQGQWVKCNKKKIRGVVIYYTAAKGYTGPDTLEFRVIYPDGHASEDHYTINVQ